MDPALLNDVVLIDYLTRNEALIQSAYHIPHDASPAEFLLQLVNDHSINACAPSKVQTYSSYLLYASKKTECSFCKSKLKIKKKVIVKLHDDIFGSKNIDVVSKYCKSCKLTIYPGFAENYESNTRFYDSDWEEYGIFMSTFSSAFSIDFLSRFVSLKQKCCTTFMGRANAYNIHHGYTTSDDSMDKRRLSEAYYKYTLLKFKERYSLPRMICGSIRDAMQADYQTLHQCFQERYRHHICDTPGCKNCLVIDGHMKAHRKVCQSKGCEHDPKHQSKFCDLHSKQESHTIDEENRQSLSENEFHIERIKRKCKQKGEWVYEVAWQGYEEGTFEPKENIPRVLVELFERYGDITIQTEVDSYFKKNGIKYVELKVDGKDSLVLPACSMEVNEEAYYLPSPVDEKCNTEKTKTRFYHRTGGVLVMAKPCGIVVDVNEIFGGESTIHVAEMIESLLEISTSKDDIEVVLYDDACHLKRHVDCRCDRFYPHLKKCDMRVDRFHFPNHVDPWCKANMDPSKCPLLKGVNSEVMEQLFSWLKGYAPSFRYMNRAPFNFLMLDLLDRHNMDILAKSVK